MESVSGVGTAHARGEFARMYSCRAWLVALAVGCALAFGSTTYSRAQDTPPRIRVQEADQRATEPLQGSLATPTAVPEQQPTYVLPPAGWPTIDFDQQNPLLDRPYAAPPGFFANTETNVLFLHLHNRLSGPVQNTLTGATDQVNLGRTNLDPAVAQRFEVGYRIPDNWGTCSFGYGFMSTDGGEVSATGADDVFQGPGDKTGRLVYNIWDLSYGSREYCLDPFFNMRLGVGARMMSLYFDSRASFNPASSDLGTVLAQSESNYVLCYGFWAYLDLERQIGASGLSGFLRVEGSDFYARSRQNYAETVAAGPGQGSQTFGSSFTGPVGPSILREVVGISYTVPQWNHSRFMLGYQYEQFFQIGRQSPTSGIIDTRGSLDAHGFFLRAEFSF